MLATGAVLVSACSVPQVASMSKNVSTHAAAKPRGTATATPSPSATSTPSSGSAGTAGAAASTANAVVATTSSSPVPRGDLVFGSLTHKLPAGDRTLVVNYWTGDNPYHVSAVSPMTLQLAAHLEGGNVFSRAEVSRFSAQFDDGSTASSVSDDKGSFALTQPFSYSTAFNLRPTVTHATLATVTVEFDLLIETQPGSGEFYRQTVLDTLHIAFQASGTSGSQS